MKQNQILCGVVLSSTLLLGGCSWFNNDPQPTMTPSTQPSAQPTDSGSMNNSTMMNQDLMNYFQTNNYPLDNITPLDNMDFNALEGSSFMHNNQMYYLYRFDSNNEESKKMLDYAQETGKFKVNMDGTETEYNAYINGNYALIYDAKEAIEDLKEVFSRYTINMPSDAPKN